MEKESYLLHKKLNDIAGKIYLKEKTQEYHDKDYSSLIQEFNSLFEVLYKQSVEDNYFWQYCPYKVFKSHFEARYQQFLNEYIDCERNDFIEKELMIIKSYEIDYHGKRFFKFGFYELPCFETDDFDDEISLTSFWPENQQKVQFSQDKKYKYLQSLLSASESEQSEEEVSFYELETKKQIVTTLYLLGMLDPLTKIPPCHYPAGMANILAPLFKIKATTLQPFLNKLINGTGEEKNNPLDDITLEKVRNKLASMGVDLRKLKPPGKL